MIFASCEATGSVPFVLRKEADGEWGFPLRVPETSAGLASDQEGRSFEKSLLWVLWGPWLGEGAPTTQGGGTGLGQSQRAGL